jgi:hypothetical protein
MANYIAEQRKAHERLMGIHQNLKNALGAINDVPTRDLHQGNFVEWFHAVNILNMVEIELAHLLQPQPSTAVTPNKESA